MCRRSPAARRSPYDLRESSLDLKELNSNRPIVALKRPTRSKRLLNSIMTDQLQRQLATENAASLKRGVDAEMALD
jgi:hypothetical protein